MSTRSGHVCLALLLLGVPLLTISPLRLGAVRVVGVDLLWWYAGLVAPVAAAVTALLTMYPAAPRGASVPGADRASPRGDPGPAVAGDSPSGPPVEETRRRRRAPVTSRARAHGDGRGRPAARARRARR